MSLYDSLFETVEKGRIGRVRREFLRYHRLCPIRVDRGGQVVVAVADDVLSDGIDELELLMDREVRVELTDSAQLEAHIERFTTALARHEHRDSESVATESGAAADARDLANRAPVIRYVNLLLGEAHGAGASDVHLESGRSELAVRFRVDGILMLGPPPPLGLDLAIISRLKLLADLDIAERRRPQDGRIRVRMHDRQLDIRISTTPTAFGESVVLRLLHHGGRPEGLASLGMPRELLDIVRALARRPSGLLLATGPTGSGKTTTLYAALLERDLLVEKVITVEDPIEYELPTISQVPVNRQAGVTFSTALRSILRQDPDALLIGEMRDRETVEIALQAALTGHAVFSSLHTEDSATAITRLIDLGAPPFLVAATVSGVVAQRLVRRICRACTVMAPVADVDQALLSRLAAPQQLHEARELPKAAGCDACKGTGYSGRIGLFEVAILDESTKSALARGATLDEVRTLAEGSRKTTLRMEAWRAVASGETSVEEIGRALV